MNVGRRVRRPASPTERLATLIGCSLDISRSRDVEEIARRTVDTCLDVIGSDTGALRLFADDGDPLTVAACRGPATHSELVRSLPSVPVDHTGGNEAVFGDRTFLVGPLLAPTGIIGILAVAAPAGRRRPDDSLVVRGLASQAAFAFDNLRLSRQLRLERQRSRRAANAERTRRDDERQLAARDFEQTDLARRRALDQLVAAHEEERRRIADDIHADSLQVLDAAILRLDMLCTDAADDGQRARLIQVKTAVEEAERRLRSLLFDLHPPAIEAPDGLRWAVQEQLEQMEASVGITWEMDVRLPSEVGLQARITTFRIVQEALRNVVRHAHASIVRVRLEDSAAGVLASVHDDGRGFSVTTPLSPPGRFGLTEMTGRAELVGGWLRMQSEVGRGTLVESWVPCEHEHGVAMDPGEHRLAASVRTELKPTP